MTRLGGSALAGAAIGLATSLLVLPYREHYAKGASWPLVWIILGFVTAGVSAGAVFGRLTFERFPDRTAEYLRWTLTTTTAFVVLGTIDMIRSQSARALPLWLTLGVLTGIGLASLARFLRE